MVEIGRGIRIKKDFNKEVQMSKDNHFDFLQIWYINGELKMPNIESNRIEYLKNLNYKTIIHALFELTDFEEYGDDLIETLQALDQDEVIIHPVFSKDKTLRYSPDITADFRLVEIVHRFSRKAKHQGIKVYIQNNCLRENFNHSTEQIKALFERDDYIDFVLDFAHVDSMEHLKELVSIKTPKCLLVCDKDFEDDIEHLPIGMGDIDFKQVFGEILKDYDGKIIMEVEGLDEEISESRDKIKAYLK